MSKEYPPIGSSVQIRYPLKGSGRIVETPTDKKSLPVSHPEHGNRGVWIDNGKNIAHYPWTSFSLANVEALPNPPPDEQANSDPANHLNETVETFEETDLEALQKFLSAKF